MIWRVIAGFAFVLCMANAAAAQDFAGPGWYRVAIVPPAELASAPSATRPECEAAPALGRDKADTVCFFVGAKGQEVDIVIAQFSAAIAAQPTNAVALMTRGIVYEQKGENEKALADFAKAMIVRPDDYWPYTLRGSLEVTMGRRDAAIQDFKTALTKHPSPETEADIKKSLAKLGAAP